MSHRSSNIRRSEWVVDVLDLQPTDHVLEVGFGPGIAIAALARAASQGRIDGVDHSAVMLRQATRRNAAAVRAGLVQLRVASVDDLPAYATPFDAIVAVNSLPFWPEPTARLEELRLLLRAGGRIAIASQPRSAGATEETSRSAARELETALDDAGYSDLRVEMLDLQPPAVCVIGTAKSLRCA
jgi:ubiquinone/menaquinone biosynthesis C-methylase UbiE